ncbi:MAG: glycosyltransferase family 39 protein [bacterium]
MVTPSRKLPLWLLGVMLLALALRLFHLGHQSLWTDEMISLELATYARGAEFFRGLMTDIHGPFTSLLLHGWTRLGTSEAWLRLLYAIPGVLAIPLAWKLGAALFDERVGRVTALLMAISPFHVWYSQEVRSYSWAILWDAGALLLFLRAWDGKAGRGAWVGLAVLCALSLLTNFSAGFLLAGLSAAVLAKRPFSWGFAGRWAGVVLFAAAVFSPWFIDWYHRMGAERVFVDAPSPMGVPLRGDSGFSWREISYLGWAFAFGYSLGPPLQALHLDRSLHALAPYLPAVAIGVAAIVVPLIGGLGVARERGRLGWLAATALVPLGLAVLLAARDVKTFNPRYLIAFFPQFLAVLAAGFCRTGRLFRLSRGVALVLAGIALGQLYFDPAYAKEDSRAAARLVLREERPGDSVVVIYAWRPFRYYFSDTAAGKAPLHALHKRFLRTDEDLRKHVADVSRGEQRVWLVLSRWWDVAPEARIRRAFEEQLSEEKRWDLPGVKVTLYDVRRA